MVQRRDYCQGDGDHGHMGGAVSRRDVAQSQQHGLSQNGRSIQRVGTKRKSCAQKGWGHGHKGRLIPGRGGAMPRGNMAMYPACPHPQGVA